MRQKHLLATPFSIFHARSMDIRERPNLNYADNVLASADVFLTITIQRDNALGRDPLIVLLYYRPT